MATWVCLLRAINLGSRNKVPMPALREALTVAGFTEVQTYVQSGNLVVTSRHRSAAAVSEAVRSVVRERFDVDQPVVVRTAEQIRAVVEGNPFAQAGDERPKLLHVVFLTGAPSAEAVERVHSDELTRDVVRVAGEDMYVDYGESVHASKLSPAYFSRRLGVEGTARNWRTVLALAEMTSKGAG
jgi:uncharacterized protein (DUF1697 family)